MRPDPFQAIRARVDIREAARACGLVLDAKGWARCPFHSDTHASMSFKGHHWRCWVCNVGGDVIDLVGRLYGLEPLQAARRVNEDFHLGLSFGRPLTPRERQEAQRREELRQAHAAFELWREHTHRKLIAVYRLAGDALALLKHPGDDVLLTPREEAAIRGREKAEYWADTLAWGEPEEQAELYKRKEEIDQWTDRILKPS